MTDQLVNKFGVTSRQLADQLKTVFVALLVSIYATILMSGTNVPLQRESWWHFVIVSVVVPPIWWFMGRKKLSKGWWWGSLCFVLGYVWFLYWISGIRLPTLFFIIFIIFLLGWTLFDLFALALKIHRPWKEGKISRVIAPIVKRLDPASWLLGLFVLITSILLGWMRLMKPGVSGFWMDALLILGMIVIIVYAISATSVDELR
jgi:hypothetical protein